MKRSAFVVPVLAATTLSLLALVSRATPVSADTGTFSNTTPILPVGAATSGNYAPFPSPVTVTGLTGTITSLTVTLTNVNHTFPDDFDILLQGPTGALTMLLSDGGGSVDLANVTLVFDGSAANAFPDSTAQTQAATALFPNSAFTAGGGVGGTGVYTGGSATFRPTDYEVSSTEFTAPGPTGPYPATFAGFTGLAPNGTYNLFVRDDTGGDAGSISGGWSVTVNTAVAVPEPGTLALLLPGMGALIGGVTVRRRKRAA